MGYRWSHVQSEEKPSRSARMPASSSDGQSVYWFQQRAPNLMSFMATSVRGSDLGRRRGRDVGDRIRVSDPHERLPGAAFIEGATVPAVAAEAGLQRLPGAAFIEGGATLADRHPRGRVAAPLPRRPSGGEGQPAHLPPYSRRTPSRGRRGGERDPRLAGPR